MNVYYVAAIWMGMALLASVVSIRIAVPAALVEIVTARWPGTSPASASTSPRPSRDVPGERRLARAHVPGRCGDRSGVAARPLEGEPVDRACLLLAAVPGAFGFCRLVLGMACTPPRSAASRSARRRSRSSTRSWSRPASTDMTSASSSWRRVSSPTSARCWRSAACSPPTAGCSSSSSPSPRHRAAAPRLTRLAISGRAPGHRTGDQAAAGGPVRPRRAGYPGGQRGGPARVCRRAGGGRVFLHDRVLMDRLRSIAFALLTPFFFLRAGTLISAPALVSGAG